MTAIKQRIQEALLTTPRTDYADLNVKVDHRQHRYDARCALCGDDVDALTTALITVFVGELKADWARYRGRVLQEAWEALRDAEGGPLIDAMNVVINLTEKR